MLTPNAETTTYAVSIAPPGPKLTPHEQALLQKILEAAEAEIEFTNDEAFYSVFQKLVDI